MCELQKGDSTRREADFPDWRMTFVKNQDDTEGTPWRTETIESPTSIYDVSVLHDIPSHGRFMEVKEIIRITTLRLQLNSHLLPNVIATDLTLNCF